jgi:tetratricopeptide (TPR) repeat protein
MRSLRRALILSSLLLAAAPAAMLAQVRAWEGTIELPTYLLGEEDPNPPFPLVNPHRIYPYTMLDDLTDQREVKKYKTLNLENEYLKATVLPEMGGRLYSLYDKATRREVFYRNNVVKYGLVALRGAWISGGIEWNFPDGHSTVTVSPVASAVRKNTDGSATILIGDIDRVSGMHWEAALTLRPGEARLRQDVTLFNATPLSHLYWFWATAAVPASDDMQFIYPMREAYPHTKGVVWPFPMHDGTDWSWYKNVREPTSFFARHSKRGFFGAYYHESDYGVVHVAGFREVPGKKAWTWGVADDGLIWTNLLTDHDGPYNEIQAGRFETQLNYEFMAPRRVEKFTEYWYPVRGLGEGFVEATERLALNVNIAPAGGKQEARVEVGISPATAITRPRIQVFLGSRLLREELPSPLSPLASFKFGVPLAELEEAKKGLSVEVRSAGRLLARWSAAEPVDGNPDFVPAAGKTAPAVKPTRQLSAEELFLRGLEVEKGGEVDAAAEIFREVLEGDAGYVPALQKLAWRDYRAADFQSAEGYVARALARDGTNPQTHYVAGVVYRAAQRWGLAQDALWAAIRYGSAPAPAYALLGEIAIHEKRYDEAAKLLRQSLSFNPEDALVVASLAVTLRLGGKRTDAADAINRALQKMGLLPFALVEQARIAPQSPAAARWKRILGYDVDKYLEVAAWYRRLGDGTSVDSVLQAAIKDFPAGSLSPMAYYYLASNARQNGNIAEAQRYAELAAAAPYEKVFPQRHEDALVLDEAIRENPTDAHARYFLGNFLFAQGRYEDAARLWMEALGLGFEYSVLYRNLGVYAWRVKKNLQDAAGFFEKAIELAPNDFRLYVDADATLTQLADTPRRERLFARAPAAVLERDTVRVRQALLLVELKQFPQALGLLKDHRFKPWEGGVGVRQAYVACSLEQGRAALAAGRPAEAVEAFRRATEYPENLGVGKPNEPHDEEALYWLGEALRAAGDAEGARNAWQQAAKGGRHISPPEQAFQGAALARLGRREESQKLFAGLMEALSGEKPGASAFYAAGLTEMLGGRTAQALPYFRRALEIDPGLWPARLELEREM